jgi:hypothetical protein
VQQANGAMLSIKSGPYRSTSAKHYESCQVRVWVGADAAHCITSRDQCAVPGRRRRQAGWSDHQHITEHGVVAV